MQKTSTKQLTFFGLKKNSYLAYIFLLLASLITHDANAQHTTPTINGIFDGAGIYPNSLLSDGRTWYVTWDNTNLYVFVQGAGGGNRVLMYFDTNPSTPVNGGATGSVAGINYSNTNLITLPFSAEAFVALETGYRQLNTSFTGTSFSGPINVTSNPDWAFAESGGNFEARIPWNQINNGLGRPAAFNWFGYITDNNAGGNYFARVPLANPAGVLGTTLPNATNTAGYERYFKITNTGNTTSTNPFSLDCYTFVRFTGVDANPFGAITVFDFTMNTPSRSIVRASDASSWTINGALRVDNGSISFGSNTGTCVVSGTVTVGANGTLSPVDGDLTANGDVIIDGTFNPGNSTVRFSGTGTQSIRGTATPITFSDIVVSKPDSRAVLTLPSTVQYFNGLHFGQNITLTGDFSLDSGLVFFSPVTDSGTFNHNIQGNMRIGSAASSVFQPTLLTVRTNTALVVNNRTNTTVNATINGDFEEGAFGSGGVALILAGANSGTGSVVNFRVDGDFLFSTRPLSWACNTSPTGVGSILMTLESPRIELGSTSTFNGNRPGTTTPTIRIQGKSTIEIPPSVFLGAGATVGGTNALANWEITNNATLTSGSAIAINMGRTLTLEGSLTCEDGAQLIGTATGSSTGSPTLVMGPSGILRVADADGLGDGTLIGSPNDSITPPNAPLFFRQKAPAQALQLTNPVPANWVLNSISTNGEIEYNGSVPQVLTPRSGAFPYNNLRISGGGLKTASASVEADSLSLDDGIVEMGANTFTILSTEADALSGGSDLSFIRGRIARTADATPQSRRFPFGTGTTYRPVSLICEAVPPTTIEGRLVSQSANFAAINAPLDTVSNLRYYAFRNIGSDDITINGIDQLAINADDSVNSTSLNLTLRIATRTTGGWESRGPTGGVNTSSLPTTFDSDAFTQDIGTLDSFFVALGTTNAGDDPLPVELLSFTGTSTVQGVKLRWETASESESNGFTVLRRLEGENAWTEVSSYQSDNALRAQNALNGASYSFTDKALLEVGKSYEYQLRETGFDGQVATLETITLTIRFNTARLFELAQNYPNPFNPVTTIRYQIPTAETVNLKVYDILGKEVATLVNGRQEAGSYTVPFNAVRLASGVYFYRLQAGGFVETRKMLLVK
jgi:hypothetical protein